MTNTDAQLKSIIERAERLEEQKREVSQDQKELWQEAKSAGHDVAALKETLKRRMEDPTKREKRERKEEMTEIYLASLGALSTTPLGEAALQRAGLSKGA